MVHAFTQLLNRVGRIEAAGELPVILHPVAAAT